MMYPGVVRLEVTFVRTRVQSSSFTIGRLRHRGSLRAAQGHVLCFLELLLQSYYYTSTLTALHAIPFDLI